jgi:tRNA (adenine57-N1/adenine58-N1)-methyltransferase
MKSEYKLIEVPKKDLTGAFSPGNYVLGIDSKNRKYFFKLTIGEKFFTHAGYIKHDDLIGRKPSFGIKTDLGQNLIITRPSFEDIILNMKRGAQVIYPKDIAAIVGSADLFPGARVLEAGAGSGALSLGLLNSDIDLIICDLRQDFLDIAINNVVTFSPYERTLKALIWDIYEGFPEGNLDRIILDLPSPQLAVRHAADALNPGGILVSYSPSVNQITETKAVLDEAGFFDVEIFELLKRTWHIKDKSIRPDHRMVAHTGFIVKARI